MVEQIPFVDLSLSSDDKSLFTSVRNVLVAVLRENEVSTSSRKRIIDACGEIRRRLQFGPGFDQTNSEKVRHESADASEEWMPNDPEALERFGFILYNEQRHIIDMNKTLSTAAVEYAGPNGSWGRGEPSYRLDGKVTPLALDKESSKKTTMYAGNTMSGDKVSFEMSIVSMIL